MSNWRNPSYMCMVGLRLAGGLMLSSAVLGNAIRGFLAKGGEIEWTNGTHLNKMEYFMYQWCSKVNKTSMGCKSTLNNSVDVPNAYKAAAAMAIISLIMYGITIIFFWISFGIQIWKKTSEESFRPFIFATFYMNLFAVVCALIGWSIFGTWIETYYWNNMGGMATNMFLQNGFYLSLAGAAAPALVAGILIRASAYPAIKYENSATITLVHNPPVAYGAYDNSIAQQGIKPPPAYGGYDNRALQQK